MFREKIAKQISILVALTLIIGLMSAFVLPKNTRADEVETTTQEETTAPEPVDPDEYEMVAHRGFSGVAPENSKPAFQKAIDAGFQHIEIDIRRCKEDSEGHADWVVCHDDNLKRLCGVNRKIEDMTLSEIKKYSYKTGSNIGLYKNLKILSLQELISYMKECKDKGIDVDWRIELKKLESTDQKEQLDEEVTQPLVDDGVEDCVTFISFYYTNLVYATENHPEIPVCFLAEVLEEKYLDYAVKLRDTHHLQVESVIFRGSTNTTDEMEIQAALEAGFKVGAYGVDSRVVMGTYYYLGVRSFTTNKVSPQSMNVSAMKHQYSKGDFSYKISKKNYTFTNTRKKPTLTVTYEGEELLEGLCYEISYANNKYPGKGTVTATFIRNISGEKDKTFTITMPKVKDFKLVKNNATSVKYQWTPNTDITGYKVYRYNYSTKKYKLVKTIKKNKTKTYKAKNLPTATKVRYRVKTYVTYKKKTYKSKPCAGKTTYTKPAAENKIKMTRSKNKKKIKIKFGKLARVTGYKVRISTDKNFTKNVKVKTVYANKHSIKLKKLKKKKTYYAKVRGYLKVGYNMYYGKYSKVVHKKGKKAKKKDKKKKDE